jgi:hypothetical protein
MTRTMPRLTALAVAVSMTVIVAAQESAPDQTSRTPRICIAIPLPAVQGVEGSAADVGNAIRELFTSYLAGPAIQVTSLDARLASQALEEALQKGCGQVLIASLTRRRSSGGGMFGRVVGQAGSSVAWQIPGGGVATAVARGVAIAGAHTVSELAHTTRAKDEMKLEYRITSSDGGAVVKPAQEKLKASVDGEDLLTPLVRRASESIVAAQSSSH